MRLDDCDPWEVFEKWSAGSRTLCLCSHKGASVEGGLAAPPSLPTSSSVLVGPSCPTL